MVKKLYVEEGVDEDNQIAKLESLLARSGFYKMIPEKGVICIKINLSPASQKKYKYYTDPELVDHLVKLIKTHQPKTRAKVFIVEAKSSDMLAFPNITIDDVACNVGYKNQVIDLSEEDVEVVSTAGFTMEVSSLMFNADLIINFAKAKNHDLMKMTGALKNMYGSIVEPNKYRAFHKKEYRGMDVIDATYFINSATPPGFNIIDFVTSVDGNEKSFYRYDVTDVNPSCHYQAGMLIAGKNPVAIDKFLSVKMGYEQNESPIVGYIASQTGDFDIFDYYIDGSDFSPLEGWRKVTPFRIGLSKFQDKIPVSDDVIISNIRKYKFDVRKKCKRKEGKKDKPSPKQKPGSK